jgi:nitroreductase
LGGALKDELSSLMLAEHERNTGEHCAQYSYYPQELPEPYRSRKYQFGVEYYGGLGIEQSDAAARSRQSGRNFLFFDAPVGLIFTIDRRLEIGSWLDLGMFMQNVMLAAKARGIDTCPQEALSRYHAIVREHLPIEDSELVVCGMSVGYADESRQPSRRCMKRASLDDLASFHGL